MIFFGKICEKYTPIRCMLFLQGLIQATFFNSDQEFKTLQAISIFGNLQTLYITIYHYLVNLSEWL
jgi:hypothetical protein